MGEFEITRRVRDICLALPEVTERPSHGAPAFFVRRQFVMLVAYGHHEIVRHTSGALSRTAPKRI